MLILDRLYNCASEHLEGNAKNWIDFAREFKSIFSADMIFYSVKNDKSGWLDDSLKVISTTNQNLVSAYLESGFHRQANVNETTLRSLEPSRRSDVVPDEEFRKLGETFDFFAGNGIFYLMIVPAIMSDKATLNLVVWRDEDAGDFDEQEKMRLGLFVRYLLKVVDPIELVFDKHNCELERFGKTYGLTETETEILGYIQAGYSPRKIATETDRTYGTVRWHIRNLLEKCHVSDQKNLVRQFYALIKN